MSLGRDELLDAGRTFLGHPRLVTAITSVSIGVAALAFPIRQLSGWAGLIAIVATLVVLAGASIVARWTSIEWRGLLPISLIVFIGWTGLTLIWSQYTWASLWALAYLGAFTLLGFYVALLRDTIQIVRAFGDVLRLFLGVSIALEIISGVLIDTPIDLFDISGNLASLGPIQGLAGTRNQLGIYAVIALITFGTEYRTRSVPRGLAIGSIVAAAIALLLTRSPVAIGALAVVCLAGAALYGLRRVAPERAALLADRPADHRHHWRGSGVGVPLDHRDPAERGWRTLLPPRGLVSGVGADRAAPPRGVGVDGNLAHRHPAVQPVCRHLEPHRVLRLECVC